MWNGIWKWSTDYIYPDENNAHFNSGEVASLIYSELGPSVHLLEAVKHVRPEVVLLHRPPLVVDLVKDVDDPSADEDGGVVKVVHEAV